ncbi:MAG: 3-hydroxyacyl-CoA dehydrogenase NAD-binding domain-containing protein [Blastocatellia bacterium]|nr:3-hydroxyacyl-CoA dehydrogenase NAD-binding domain-containing protein [Blastocatellia bacterium]
MNELVSFSRNGNLAVITINNPPVNALSPGVPEGIAAGIARANAEAGVEGVVLIGGGRTFIAGADIREFGKVVSGEKTKESLLPLLLALEDSARPVVAALHGSAFGGGLEIAMACHYRIAAADAQVGQPEVKLGIIPGAAGTQRLPRLAGVAKALEMCVSGAPVKAADALAAGIVDQLIDGDLLTGAMAFLREKIASGARPPKTRERNDNLGDEQTNAPLFAAAREQTKRTARGLTAPFAAIDAIEAATKQPFDEGCRTERRLFEQCLFSDQARALMHVFFAEREVAKIPGLSPQAAPGEIRKAAIIGAGTMGGGIAMNFANAGIPVLLKESEQDALDRGLATISKNYASTVKKGRLTEDAMRQRLALIQPTLSYDGFEEADVIIEAVYENMALKKEIFAELDRRAKPGALLASNTSSLNLDEIAATTSRAASVIGLHFFSPANVMRLLEIVRGKATSDEAIATAFALGKRMKKVGVLVGNCHGFVGNRMFFQYMREAHFLVEEGASVEAVDKALVDFGMAMGMLAVDDMAGIDVGVRVRQENRKHEAPGRRQPRAVDRLYELGRYGQKTGVGWYKYDENRRATPDPEVAALIEQVANEAGIARREIDAKEIVDRCILALINEGARILEEGYALRAGDIDIIYLNGYGFPAWRGGPMWHADTVGVKNVYDRVCELHAAHGDWWTPAPLLRQLAEQGGTFAGWDKERAAA